MNARVCSTLFVAVFCVICGCGKHAATDRMQQPDVVSVDAGVQHENVLSPIHSVDTFDAKANPSDDLIATVSQASKSRKRIILEVGTTW